jgi:hypothetical protein
VILEEEGNKNGARFSIHQEQRLPNTMLQWLLSQKKTGKGRVCNLAAEVASLLSGMGLEASLINLIDIT